jgi:hypothetical protein
MPYTRTVTCGPIARERIDKQVSMEMESWRPTWYGTRFHANERKKGFRVNEWSTNVSLDTDALVRGSIIGHPVPGEYKYRDLALQVGEMSHETRGPRTREWLRWQGPAATVNDRPIFSSKRAHTSTNPQQSDRNNNLYLNPRCFLLS